MEAPEGTNTVETPARQKHNAVDIHTAPKAIISSQKPTLAQELIPYQA